MVSLAARKIYNEKWMNLTGIWNSDQGRLVLYYEQYCKPVLTNSFEVFIKIKPTSYRQHCKPCHDCLRRTATLKHLSHRSMNCQSIRYHTLTHMTLDSNQFHPRVPSTSRARPDQTRLRVHPTLEPIGDSPVDQRFECHLHTHVSAAHINTVRMLHCWC